MKKVILVLLLALNIPNLNAQISDMEDAVMFYDAMVLYCKGVSVPPTNEQLKIITDYSEKGVAITAKILASENEQEKLPARYLKMMFRNRIAMHLFDAKKYEDALVICKELIPEFSYFTESVFPVYYKHRNSTESFTYSSFLPFQRFYYSELASLNYYLKQYEDCNKWGEVAITLESGGLWSRYITLDKILKCRDELKLYDKKTLDYAMDYLKTFDGFTYEEHQKVITNNYPNEQNAYLIIKSCIKAPGNYDPDGYYCGEAGSILMKYDLKKNALYLLQTAFEKGYKKSDKYHLMKVADCIVNNNIEDYITFSYDIAKQLATLTLECSDKLKLSGYFAYGRMEKEAKYWEHQHNKCLRDEKPHYHKDHKGGIYAGYYPLSLLTFEPEKFDHGAALHLMGKVVGHTFSYTQYNKNKDYLLDMISQNTDTTHVLWDGNRMFYEMRFYSPNTQGFYIGFQAAKYHRDYDTVRSWVSGVGHNKFENFTTHADAYEFLYTMGVVGLGEKFGPGIDMYFGMGAMNQKFTVDGYPDYSGGNPLFEHPMLKYRQPQKWTPVFRCGITIGLGWKGR